MAASAIMESPVRMTLHSVISKEDLSCSEDEKVLPTTITMQPNTSLMPVPLDFPLNLDTYMGSLYITFVSKSRYSQVLEQIYLYFQQISFQAKGVQGKELKFTYTHTDNHKKLLDLDSKDINLADLEGLATHFKSVSSDIAVEVKVIFLEAKFKVINEVVLPPCGCDSLTTKALEKFTNEKTDVKIFITSEQDRSLKDEGSAPPVQFFAHKDVLVTRSPVFAKMFEHDLQESATSSITVSDIKPEVFKEVLSFIYNNQVPNLSTMAASLLYAAEKYQLDGLKARCEQFLSYNLQVSNAVQTLQWGHTYNASQLKENASRFIIEYIDEVRKSNDWKIVASSNDLMGALLQVPNMGTMACPLLHAAENHQLNDIKAKCEQFLSHNLQVDNVIQALQLAQTCNASQLKENAARFIIEFIDEVRESKDWKIVASSNDLMVTLLSRVEPAAKRHKTD